MRILQLFLSAAGLLCACSSSSTGDASGDLGGDGGDESGSDGGGNDGGGDDGNDGGGGDGNDSGDGDDGPKFDTTPPDGEDGGGGPGNPCKVEEGGDAPPPCDDEAPPHSFELDIQWQTSGIRGDPQPHSMVTALVANLTDDDGNGKIDLCDDPDIVIVDQSTRTIVVLDGGTGEPRYETQVQTHRYTTPALGDLDGDGVPEIVAQTAERNIGAFGRDGAPLWISTEVWPYYENSYGSIALADLDNDADVEVIAGNRIFDHDGNLLLVLADQAGLKGFGNSTVAVDLDGDGDLEVVLGRSAYHHDGSEYYLQGGLGRGHPAVADLDADGRPEILLHNEHGMSLLEHDGSITVAQTRPTGHASNPHVWHRPSCVHDFDANGDPELAVSIGDKYGVWEPDFTSWWLTDVVDVSGISGGTAFDFLGDGGAEAMYADEKSLYIFDDAGNVLLEANRRSSTLIEYPVVADVDNDGSAEIVVTGLGPRPNEPPSPTIRVIRDKHDRWVGARRIWNQHTYHVTNVREDGTISQFETPHWEHLNTFRTQAQINADGSACQPDPEG